MGDPGSILQSFEWQLRSLEGMNRPLLAKEKPTVPHFNELAY